MHFVTILLCIFPNKVDYTSFILLNPIGLPDLHCKNPNDHDKAQLKSFVSLCYHVVVDYIFVAHN